ncbi:MAG: hypothetical protein Q7U60_07550 [Candidatus Methanoperedens sp.]|nr:hypothetical protein [Candidatus Methanoperedens sp.]
MNLKIIIAFILILAVGGAFYVSLQKDTEILIVNVTLAKPPDNDSAKIISNVSASFSYARKMEVPAETPLELPGITVLVIQNMQEKSAWYSVPIPVDKSIYGDYTITVKLSNKIDRTQPVRILTRVVDPNGKDVSVRAADIMLE